MKWRKVKPESHYQRRRRAKKKRRKKRGKNETEK